MISRKLRSRRLLRGLRSPSWANEVDGEDVGVSGSGACPAEGSLAVLLYTVEVSLPGFEYLRGS